MDEPTLEPAAHEGTAKDRLREQERRHAFLLMLGDRLRGRSDPVAIMEAASEALGRHLAVSRVGYGEIDLDEQTVHVERDWTDGTVASLAGETRPLDVFGPAIIKALRTGRALQLSNIAADPRSAPYAPGYASIGTRSLLVVPLIKDGRFTAILYLHEPAARQWSDADAALAQEVAERTWAAVVQARAEAALRQSEARFRAAVQAVSGILWTNNAAGEMVGEQPGWATLTGQTFEEYQGYGWAKAAHPEDAQPTVDAWSRAVAERRPFIFEHRIRRHDGAWRYFAIRAIPAFDQEGAVREWVGVHTDVTEQRDTEATLREESHTLEVLNRTGSALAAELGLDRIVQKVTDAATELSGAGFGAFFYNVVEDGREAYTLYAISGVPREAFSKFPMPRNTAVFGPTFRGEGIIRSDDITLDPRYGQNTPRHGMPEGHLPVRSYLAVSVVSRSGEVLGGLFFGHPKPGVFTERAERIVTGIAAQAAIAIDNARLYEAAQREVVARKAAEDSLRRLNETLERLVEERTAALLREVEERRRAEEALRQGEKLQAIGQLTGGIAHDFNNIMQVVTSGATLLRLPNLPQERKAIVLDGMTKAAQNAKELTSRLLAFARKQALQPVAFNLNERFAGMSELLRHTLGSRIRVENDFAPDLWPVHADPSQFEVAVLNLAVNARDAMLPEGGVLILQTRSIPLEATSERAGGAYVCVAVRDTGKGIPPAVLARVFEPFFTTKGPDKGTGLGLAQVHGFAKQSGGDIAIESVPGEGTTVTIHLPRATSAARPAAPLAQTQESDGTALQRTAGKIVLVVEDNPDVASFAASMLEGLGYVTRRAADAGKALALLGSGEQVHAVFSDVVMPGAVNGVQLASVLRVQFPQIAVVLATGYSEVLTEWNGQAVAEVLGKPYRLDELAAALERAFAARAAGPLDRHAAASAPMTQARRSK